MSLEERMIETRSVIKSIRGIENETLPIPSVIKLQHKRSEFLCNYWIDSTFSDNPSENGWIDNEGVFEVMLQAHNDILYHLPKKMLVSCSCQKKPCSKCICKKTEEIGGQCCIILCKKCSCFKRIQEGDKEDLKLSSQFQSILDAMSSSSEDESEDDNYSLPDVADDEDFVE